MNEFIMAHPYMTFFIALAAISCMSNIFSGRTRNIIVKTPPETRSEKPRD